MFSKNEVANSTKISLLKDNHKLTVYNIGLPTKPNLQGEDRKLQSPWFRHEDSFDLKTDVRKYDQYTFKRTTHILNRMLSKGYAVAEE
jgi:hypothetical protein